MTNETKSDVQREVMPKALQLGVFFRGHGDTLLIKAGKGATSIVVAEVRPPTTRHPDLPSEQIAALLTEAPALLATLKDLVVVAQASFALTGNGRERVENALASIARAEGRE